jgi:hypothetical protein
MLRDYEGHSVNIKVTHAGLIDALRWQIILVLLFEYLWQYG